MGQNIGTGGRAWGKILGRLAFYTWVNRSLPFGTMQGLNIYDLSGPDRTFQDLVGTFETFDITSS